MSGGSTAPGHRHDGLPGDGHRERALVDRRRLALVAVVGAATMSIEVVGGLAADSLVLLADAGHYATDLASVLLALVAVHWSLKPATARRTFGHLRGEVVAAFVQAIALWAVSAVFLYEAYLRIRDPPTVDGRLVAAVGGFTLAVNALLAYALRSRSGRNLNMRAAYLHILSDVLGSAAALVAGLLVAWKGWHVADPLLTIFITVLILVFTVRLTRETLNILLEGTPRGIDLKAIEEELLAEPGVREVHDLHVWSHTSGVESLTAHVVLEAAPVDDVLMHALHARIRGRFRIGHITLQLENPACPCDTVRHAWPTVLRGSAAPGDAGPGTPGSMPPPPPPAAPPTR